MKVKVTQCSLSMGWYKDYIDATFEATKEEAFGRHRYKVEDMPLEPGITGYYIEINDAEVMQ